MGEIFGVMGQSFTLPKLIYSVILLGVVLLLLAELQRLWLDGKTYISPFKAYDAGKLVADSGDVFTMRVVDYHSALSQRLRAVAETATPQERSWSAGTGGPIVRAESLLAKLDIKLQDIDITDILGKLRDWVSAPNEIGGSISKTAAAYRVALALPKHGAMADSGLAGQTVVDNGFVDEDQAALQVACSLIWAEAAKQGTPLRIIGRDEFCRWARVWSRSQDLIERKRDYGTLSAEEVTELGKLHDLVGSWITNGARYPMFYSLRARLTEAMPETDRASHLEEMVGDRWRYAVLIELDPKAQLAAKGDPLKLPEAIPVLARVRPAIPLKGGATTGDISAEWKAQLEPVADSVAAIAASVGTLQIESPALGIDFGPYVGSGFMVAPHVFAVARHMLGRIDNNLVARTYPYDIPSDLKVEVRFGDRAGEGTAYTVTKVLYAGDSRANPVALLYVEGDKLPPPLRLQVSKPAARLTGDAAALFAYTSADSRMPKPFIDALLGGENGLKRLMPGRIVADVATEEVPHLEGLTDGQNEGFLQYDASSSGGTAGGPTVDLALNRVVALHVGGVWKDNGQGKVAFGVQTWRMFEDPKLPEDLKKQLLAASQ